MTKEELYIKIDKFCNETDWGKYPTYEQALEEFIKGIVAEETKELEKENAKAKEIIKEILEEDNYGLMLSKEMRLSTEQFIKDSEVEK